jgi:hypothetical protein
MAVLHTNFVQSIGVRESDGVTTVFVMKQTFKNQLLGGLPNAIRGKTRDFLEKKLVGCVLANLTSFTELLAEPFIFTNLVPVSRRPRILPSYFLTRYIVIHVRVQCFIRLTEALSPKRHRYSQRQPHRNQK